MPDFISQTHPDPATCATACAAAFARWLANTPGTLTVAFSGGRTPDLIFQILAGTEYRKLPWHRLRGFWVDERWVPHSSPESNFGNAWRQLFAPLDFPRKQLFPMVAAEPDQAIPAEMAARYSRQLCQELPLANGVPILDLVLLGLGTDGHTASLFPGIEPETPNAPCSATRHPASGAPRLTLTLPVLNQARQVIFLVTGADKAATVLAVRCGDRTLPAAAVNPVSGAVAWYLDAGADPGKTGR